MRLITLFCLLALPAFAAVDLRVDVKRKTEKANERQSSFSRRVDNVDRVTLTAAVSGSPGPAQITFYFVGRDARTHALSYYGFEEATVSLARTKTIKAVESPPCAYSEYKTRESSTVTRTGTLPYGWVVVVKIGQQEVAVRQSSDQVLTWVQKNPPRRGVKIAP